MPQADRRTDEQIKRDLATEEGRGSAQRKSPTGRLVADVAPLLAEVAALRAENDELRHGMAEWVAERIAPMQAERDAARAELAAERARHETTRAALAELVRLKDGPRDAAYLRDRPLAWANARATIAALAAAASPSPVAGPDVLSEF